jgi:molecular chaperone DnaK
LPFTIWVVERSIFSILEIQKDVFEVSLPTVTHTWVVKISTVVLVNHLFSEFKETNIDLSTDGMAIQQIREAAEKAKIKLSSTSQTEINLPFITADAAGPRHINPKLLRS